MRRAPTLPSERGSPHPIARHGLWPTFLPDCTALTKSSGFNHSEGPFDAGTWSASNSLLPR
jgi:hypothetical protein